MTMTPETENILRVYRSATPDQVIRGLDWYGDAHALAVTLDPGNVRRAAGVIAALSANTPWNRNIMLAVRTYREGFASATLGNNIRAANEIYGGTDFMYVLKGPKTRAFAMTIADPSITHAVVIDRHAVSIVLGRLATDTEIKRHTKPLHYETTADYYRAAADILSVAPSVVQAVTWITWREMMIRTSAAMRRSAEKGNVPM